MGICWCVDKHGIEFDNTRTRGRPVCGNFILLQLIGCRIVEVTKIINKNCFGLIAEDVTRNAISQPSDDEDDDLDYDDNDEGSANGPISY